MTNRELDQRRRRIVANRERPSVEVLAAKAVLAHAADAAAVPLWYLRCYDTERVRAIARGGGPRYVGDEFHFYCPVCQCRKNGYVDGANGRDEPCDLYECRCHDEDADEYQTCLEHPDRPAVVETAVGPVGGVFRWQPICNTCRADWAVEPCRALTW